MPLVVNPMPRPILDQAEIQQWRDIPTTIISDELNRSGTTDASIVPRSASAGMAGQAVTVNTMAADNLAIHHAIAEAFPGAVLVVDAGGHRANAVWGGITQRAGELRRLAGVVIDGCVRDIAEIRKSPLPCFAAGVVAAGPHKNWGGTINAVVQVGRCTVAPGDIVVGDDDGIVVVPFDRRGELLEGCRKRIAFEASVIRRLEEGETTVQILGLSR